ncbi:hypothetical protein SGGMMB4_01141 [Sodalis glossinidius str. 'morsitans']|uniref:Uncharacterized protein n=1 Tax=Sodalis glossinidius (strain morsitans) TaxID=343509 RepID=A0A193QG87_SODGM|nr:hypothetical protein SGGMMB4_01141 [Sodalis glossinidius str. 'morsitans']
MFWKGKPGLKAVRFTSRALLDGRGGANTTTTETLWHNEILCCYYRRRAVTTLKILSECRFLVEIIIYVSCLCQIDLKKSMILYYAMKPRINKHSQKPLFIV